MHMHDFQYELPAELIANHPLPERSSSRLLTLDGNTGFIQDRRFNELPDLLDTGDLLVFNNTRVIPARLHGFKQTGGKVEVLIERMLDEHRVLAQVRASKSPQVNSRLRLEGAFEVEVLDHWEEFYELKTLDERPVLELLEKYGHVPLPPYINRAADMEDRVRYQTVYAKHAGAVAAPTAGLHFDRVLLQSLEAMGIESSFMILHVGAGTFQPVRVQDFKKHKMHAEYVEVTQAACDAIFRCRKQGGRIVAVGTTTVRGLETAACNGGLKPFQGDTRLFVAPGFKFQVVDVLITNFHLPASTLLMLVSAFGGHAHVMNAYRHAVNQRYRFYSYGDAMLITRRKADADNRSASWTSR